MKFNGHLIPWPPNLPKDKGISIFIAWPYTETTKMKTVDRIAVNAKTASIGFLPKSERMKTQILPTGGWAEPNAKVPAVVKGENALIIISDATPAAMNKLIPEPKPHLLTTSSIYIIS